MGGMIFSLVREVATQFLGREIARQLFNRVAGSIALYIAVVVFGGAALVFFYILAYALLSDALDPRSAAAILCAANLAAIGLIFLVRYIRAHDRPAPRGLADALGGEEIEAALGLGRDFEKKLRQSAPEIALIAAVLGIAVGARPELLSLIFGKKRKP